MNWIIILILFGLIHGFLCNNKYRLASPFPNATAMGIPVSTPIKIPYTMLESPFFVNLTTIIRLPISGFAHRSHLQNTKLFVTYVGFNYTGPFNISMQDLQKPSMEIIPDSIYQNNGPNSYQLITPTLCTSSVIGFRKDPYAFLVTCPEIIDALSNTYYLNLLVGMNQ